MKLKNIIKTLFLGSILYSATTIHADQEYAKVLFDIPEENISICAHYIILDDRFGIDLYEAQTNNLKNNDCVGRIRCRADKKSNFAYIALLSIEQKARKKNYGRILAQLALQEFANQGFKKVIFAPAAIDNVQTETLRKIYMAGGARAALPVPISGIVIHKTTKKANLGLKETGFDLMEFDISAYSKMPPEPFEDVLGELFPPKAKL
ncbi:MAG TPA: GNAT family N-acetyltransferase [Candidatus Babeliales bacterium]|nr:GNAT family N-acetyltransferase [Candidatus Babeliales bacterium]